MTAMLKKFRDFAATKPRDEVVNPMDRQNCFVAQFAKHVDPDNFVAAGFSWWARKDHARDDRNVICDPWYGPGKVYYDNIIMCQTWGDCLNLLNRALNNS